MLAHSYAQTRGVHHAVRSSSRHFHKLVTPVVSSHDHLINNQSSLQDPTEVINKYGADALRLYLINSPVVRAETLRFKEEGVFSVVKDVFLPWYNAYRCAA